MRRFVSQQQPSSSGDALRSGKRHAAVQWSVYVMLLATCASDLMRAPSSALRAHANGIGEGFTSFRYGEMPTLAHLVNRATIAEQFQDEDATEGALVDEDPETTMEEQPAIHHQEDSEDCFMEIEDDPPVPLTTPTSALTVALLASEAKTRVRPASAASTFATLSLHLNILENMLEFLPLADINRARNLSLRLGMAATRICPQPLGEGITFVRSTGLSSLSVPRPNPHAPPVPFVWRCVNCGGYSSYHEACTHCNANVRVSACRVFLGQVRKQHTAEAIRCILRVLAPQVVVLHIESHSNKDGFEKGAAWVYVDTPEQAHAVTMLHKRVLYDCDADDGEGFWFIDDASLEDKLEDFAGRRKADDKRKQHPLPGQPLVAEFPTTSMLRGFKPVALHEVASYSRHRPYDWQ